MNKTHFATFQKAADNRYDAEFVMSAATADRMGDTIDPKAYKENEREKMIALWQHNHSEPIGYWENIKRKGGEFVGSLKLANTELAKMVKQLMEDGVPLMASIGFQAKEYEPNEKGGLHFKAIDIYECSVVSVGANPAAIRIAKSFGFDVVPNGETVSFVKSIASTGEKNEQKEKSPRALGKTVSIKSTPKETKMKTFQEQIAGFQARKSELSDTVKTILQKSADEGRTLDADEAEAHDQAVAEIEQVEKHIGRLQAAEKVAVGSATPVVGDTQKAAQSARSGVITVRDNLAPGQEFARYAKCLAAAKGNLMQAEAIAKAQYPDAHRVHNVIKAAVAAGTTTDATWAGPLVEYQTFTGDFREFLRPMTILGKFGQGGIPALRSIPFQVKIHGASSGGAAGWVGEGKAKPVTSFGFETINHGWAKIASISVLTEELLRLSSPAADLLVRDLLAGALVERQDADFVDPAKAAVAGVSPASITNGVTAVAASGVDADAVRTDVKALMQKFIDAKVAPTTGVWLMNPSLALALSMMYDALGRAEFPGITMLGGTFMGFPVIVSEQIASTDLSMVVASELYLSEDSIVLDASREASILMDTAPNMNSTTPTGAQMVSMFQTNSVALRVEKFVNWSKRRATAVQRISGANYGGSAE